MEIIIKLYFIFYVSLNFNKIKYQKKYNVIIDYIYWRFKIKKEFKNSTIHFGINR